MEHNKSRAKRKTHTSECLQKVTGESIHQCHEITPKSSTTRNKYTKEQQTAGKNRTRSYNQPRGNKKNYTMNQKTKKQKTKNKKQKKPGPGSL